MSENFSLAKISSATSEIRGMEIRLKETHGDPQQTASNLYVAVFLSHGQIAIIRSAFS